MRSKDFRAEVSRRVGIDVTDSQVRYAIHLGDLDHVPKRGGWYVFGEEHIERMVDHLQRCSRKLLKAELASR